MDEPGRQLERQLVLSFMVCYGGRRRYVLGDDGWQPPCLHMYYMVDLPSQRGINEVAPWGWRISRGAPERRLVLPRR